MLTNDIFKKVEEINSSVREQLWMDFEVSQFDGNDLVIGGAISLSYKKNFITIVLKQVEFMQIRYTWNTNTELNFLGVVDSLELVNYKIFSRLDCTIFEIVSEDYGSMYVAAEDIQYDFDKEAVIARRE